MEILDQQHNPARQPTQQCLSVLQSVGGHTAALAGWCSAECLGGVSCVPCCSVAPGLTDQPTLWSVSLGNVSSNCSLLLTPAVCVSHLAYVPLNILRLGVSHRVVKSGQANPEPVEPIVRPVDCEDGSPGVGLGHSPVPLQHDDLGPDLVVY